MKGTTGLVKVPPFCFAKSLAQISGDYAFKKHTQKAGVFHGYTYAYMRRGDFFELWGSLSEAEGFTVFNADFNQNSFIIEKETEGLVIDAPYELFDIVRYKGGYDDVFDRYFADMGVKKPRIGRVSGYTSWYNYFQGINEDIILRDLNGTDRVNKDMSVFQIDDGYAPFVGDWLDKNEKFPHGMGYIADKIHEKGFVAGIWLAPFNVQRTSRTAKEHPEWLIKKKNGKPKLGCPGWGGAYTLDLYAPGVKEHIRRFFSVILNEWGFDLVKLDFLYSQCMLPRGGKTRGTIMTEAMQFLRECVGDKLMLGCGVPLGACFGVVDAMRVSCDVDLSYKPKIYNKLHVNRELPSAQNAMVNSAFRRHLNGRVFVNDPDVFFLRDFNLKFTKEEKLLLAKVNDLCGDVLFVSDDIGKYGNEEIEILKDTFAKSDKKLIDAAVEGKNTVRLTYIENEMLQTLTFKI
jgi:alpha-galactosidase